jgi:hypothetical protein
MRMQPVKFVRKAYFERNREVEIISVAQKILSYDASKMAVSIDLKSYCLKYS